MNHIHHVNRSHVITGQGSNLHDCLVAHRGDRAGGPENTLAAFRQAAASGARFAECDIQFTRDLVPVVLHDNWLRRLCGRTLAKTINMEVSDLRRFCRPHFELPTLEQLLHWLREEPQLTLFVEIKPTIRRRLRDNGIARRLAATIPPDLLPRLVLISSSAAILDACVRQLDCRIGWVVGRGRPPAESFDWVFMPQTMSGKIAGYRQQGAKVALYTVNDAARARELLQQGADLIETDHFTRLAGELG